MLKPVASTHRGMVVDLERTIRLMGQLAIPLTDVDVIIYELHVRDISYIPIWIAYEATPGANRTQREDPANVKTGLIICRISITHVQLALPDFATIDESNKEPLE